MLRIRTAPLLLLPLAALAGCERPAPTAALPGASAPSASRAAAPTESGATVVTFAGNAVPAGFAAAVQSAGGRVIFTLPQIGTAVVRGVSAAALAQISRQHGVSASSGDRIALLPRPRLGALPAPSAEPALEPFFPLQWGIRMVQADVAMRAGYTGAGARIGIADTGIFYTHPDLAANYVTGRNFFAPFCAADTLALPSTCDPNNPLDDNGHGTHVAGIVAADDNRLGVIGVAPDARLYAAKVCGRTVGCPTSAIIAGIVYLTDLGVDAINLSLGGFGDVTDPDSRADHVALKRAASYAHGRGTLIVHASGNDGIDLQRLNGRYKNVLGETGHVLEVSAVGPDSLPAYAPDTSGAPVVYTNTGNKVDVAAPGGSFPPVTAMIASTYSPLSPDLPGALYAFSIGTSMAAPHATGAAAVVIDRFGDLSPSQLQSRITRAAVDLGKRGEDPIYGKGLLNVWNAVR